MAPGTVSCGPSEGSEDPDRLERSGVRLQQSMRRVMYVYLMPSWIIRIRQVYAQDTS
jgi:hypothetical protein